MTRGAEREPAPAADDPATAAALERLSVRLLDILVRLARLEEQRQVQEREEGRVMSGSMFGGKRVAEYGGKDATLPDGRLRDGPVLCNVCGATTDRIGWGAQPAGGA
jgi:hypothetical protein